MARDGSGVYAKLAGSVAVSATTIASNPYNQQIDDVGNALNDVLLLNGVKPMSGPLAMGSNKISGVANGTVSTDAVNLGQVQSSISRHSTAVGGTADAITVTHSPVYTVYATGMGGVFTAGGANTSTTPTANIDSIGVKTIVKQNGQPLIAGDIPGSGYEVEWEYNGTNIVMLNPAFGLVGSKGTAIASAATTNIWATADDFVHITGTTTITSFGTAPRAGVEKTIIFDGALTLTHNATTLQLLGGANITTAAGDRAIVMADTTANMILVAYSKADGTALVAPATGGITSLGTQNTPSGTSQSLTGLTLTSYKFLRIVLNSVVKGSTTGNSSIQFNAKNISSNINSAVTVIGFIDVDLTSGIYTLTAVGTGAASVADASGLSTASTSVTLTATGTGVAFAGGSFTVYGLK